MSIKKKVFMTLLTMIMTVLLISYLVIYALFDKTLVTKIQDYQNTVITLNQNLISSFLKSMNQTPILLTGDEAIGKYLSEEIDDTMSMIRVRSGIQKQFSHYLSLQPENGNTIYRNTLFLNKELPIAAAFTAETLDTALPWRSSNIYSNEAVMGQDWYQRTLEAPENSYLFVDKTTNKFCFSKKIQNNYYTGPYYQEGLGVVVIQIPMNRLDEILSVSPVTPNSGFALIQEDYNVLYQSSGNQDMPADLLPYLTNLDQSSLLPSSFNSSLTLDGAEYITYYNAMDNGLSLVFYTPFSDIRSQVSQITNVYIGFAIFFIVLASLLSYLISRKITRPIIRFSRAISSIDDTRNFNLDSLIVSKDLELEILRKSFGTLISRINALIDDIRLQGERETEYKLRALQAQINPHFIYNAMDTVNWIALSKDEDEIASIVSSISNLMRYSITDPDKLVPLHLELKNIRDFISIQQVRYENHIEMTIVSGLSPVQVLIPKFTVQPLVENSILHGNDNPDAAIHITVAIFQHPDHIAIEIHDNGKGCNPVLLNRYLANDEVKLSVSGGFGIRNVNERLQLNFSSRSGLSYELDDDGHLTARIVLDLPSYQNKIHTS